MTTPFPTIGLRRLALLAIVAAQCALAAILFYAHVPVAAVYTLSVVAAAIASWLFGLLGGLIGALLIVACNGALMAFVGRWTASALDPMQLVGALGLLLVAGVVGQLRYHRDRLQQDLCDREQVEAMLKRAQKELVRQVMDRTEELAASNRLLSVEVQQRRRAESVLWALAEATSTAVGAEFFPCLVKNLASAFDARYAVIVEHLDDPVTRVRTLGFWMGDRLGEDVEYKVVGTPCQQAAEGALVYHAEGVQRLFPEDRMLADLGVEGYCALPLSNSSGRLLGHVAILDDKPLVYDLCKNPALQIFAARAAAELERRQNEDRLLELHTDLARAYRLVSMGEMASMLVHEIDQPLGVIANDAQACLRGMRSGQFGAAETLTALDEIASEALRTGEIVRRIRRFISRRAPQRSTVDLNELVREVVRLVAADTRQRRTTVELDLKQPMPKVHVDGIQIQQVLLNLVQNALEAMEESDAARRVAIRTRCKANAVWTAVSDSGQGIPPAEMRRIFEPYYTTKSDGVGMGLSISRSIIQLHDGTLCVRPNPGGGMTFEFSLPLQGSKP